MMMTFITRRGKKAKEDEEGEESYESEGSGWKRG